MTLIVHILHLVAIALLLRWCFIKNTPYRSYFVAGAALKILGGLLLGVLYEFYYGYGDTIIFYEKASQLTDIAYSSFSDYFSFLFNSHLENYTTGYENQPRALFFIKIVSVFSIITIKNYWLISIYLSLFTFLAIWKLCIQLIKNFGSPEAVFLSWLFIPSVAIWSSGVIKETLAVFAICFYTYAFLILFVERKYTISSIAILVLSAILLWKIKYYYAAVIFIFSTAFVLSRMVVGFFKAMSSSRAWHALLYMSIACLLLLIVSQAHPNFYFHRFLDVIVTNHDLYQAISNPGDAIQYYQLTSSWSSVMLNAPIAFFSGLFRPFLGENLEVMKVFYGIENLVLLGIIVYAIRHLPKELSTNNYLLILTVIFSVIVLITFLSLSAPNYGTLIRYRTGIIPFLVLICTINNQPIKRLMSRIFQGG